MKRTIFTFAAIGFVIFWFLMGFRIWTYMEWLTGISSYYFPAILGVLFLFGFKVHLIKIFPKRLKVIETWTGKRVLICRFLLLFLPIAFLVGIGDVFSMKKLKYKYHLLWMPFIFANLLWLAFYPLGFMYDSFEGNYSTGHSYLVNKDFVINQYGNIIFNTSGNCWIRDRKKGLLIVEEDKKKGIYSLKMNEYIVPLGHSLESSTITYKNGEYYGLKSKNDYILLPAIYKYISYITPNNLVLNTEKGVLICSPFTFWEPLSSFRDGFDDISYYNRLLNDEMYFESITDIGYHKKDNIKADYDYITLRRKDGKQKLFRVSNYEWDFIWDCNKENIDVLEVYESGKELRIILVDLISLSYKIINQNGKTLLSAYNRIFWSSDEEKFTCFDKKCYRYYSWDGELLEEVERY